MTVHEGRESFGRYYDDFQVGDVFKHWPGRTITEYDDILHCMQTMNHHPLHIDARYAEEETQFGKNVVVGTLVYLIVFGMTVTDQFSSFFKVLAIGSAILMFLLSEKDPVLMGSNAGTFAGLVLLSTVGVFFLSSAEDLLILFVGLELTSVPLFILAGFMRKDLRSSEGAVKFFLIGAFSTGLMVYGISFLYGLCGSSGTGLLSSS